MTRHRPATSAIFKAFIRDTLHQFTYLVREFDFEFAGIRIDGHECMITFRKPNLVAVTIASNAGDLPWVMLTGNTGTSARYKSEQVPLDTLIAQRCPDRTRAMPEGFPANDDVVRDVLAYYAQVLRDCASDVLGGDVAVFDELREAVSADYARRRFAMKKEEDVALAAYRRRRK